MQLGSIIFYKNIPQFTSWLQRVVSNTIYSHASLSMTQLTSIGQEVEFEADVKVRIHSFPKRYKNQDVLELIGISEHQKASVIKELIERFDGKSYGWIQWLTIFLRFAFKWLGFKHTHTWNILWGWGIVCSELIYEYLEVIAWEADDDDWYALYWDMHPYNPDLFVPQDIVDLAKRHPKCLRWV